MLKEVTLKSTWIDLLGDNPQAMQSKVRKERWEQWKGLATKAGETDILIFLQDQMLESCQGCNHRANDWCTWCGLPCVVNPVLTLKQNILGMACMGAGYESKAVKLN
jgi:hypothetical protein